MQLFQNPPLYVAAPLCVGIPKLTFAKLIKDLNGEAQAEFFPPDHFT
jgi:hypothetical protein